MGKFHSTGRIVFNCEKRTLGFNLFVCVTADLGWCYDVFNKKKYIQKWLAVVSFSITLPVNSNNSRYNNNSGLRKKTRGSRTTD